jgi:hypothetical protein
VGSKDDERAALQAQLDALDADDGDDDEVTISHSGKSFTGTFRRALQVAQAWGIDLIPAPPAEPAAPKDAKGAAEVKRFAGRRVS